MMKYKLKRKLDYRQLREKGLIILLSIVGLLTAGLFLSLVVYILSNGLSSINFQFIHGLSPMIVSTIYLVGYALFIAMPVGIMTAIYLSEYLDHGHVRSFIHLAIDSLSGIPSIIYGLFGLLFFVRTLQFGQSILSGALTLSIIILPTIIRTTEEALQTIPQSYREASYGLGASQLQTIIKVILPSALKGILTGIILSIGRMISESAPVLMTAGLAATLPKSLLAGGRSLSVHLYYLTNELIDSSDYQKAFATATVILFIVVTLNLLIKLISQTRSK